MLVRKGRVGIPTGTKRLLVVIVSTLIAMEVGAVQGKVVSDVTDPVEKVQVSVDLAGVLPG